MPIPSNPTTTISQNKGRCQNCHRGFHATENCRLPGGAKEGVPYPNCERKPGAATATLTWEKPSHAFLVSTHAFLASSKEELHDPKLNTFFTSHSASDYLVLDSGCSIHMSPHGDWFVPSTLKNLSHDHSVHVANGQELMATMISTLRVNPLANGMTLEGLFPNTLLIPNLSMTL